MKVILVILTIVLGVLSLNSGACSKKLEPVTLGMVPLESSALIYIAESRGFFASNGLSVTIKDYDTGAAAHNGMLKAEIDIALPAEYPLVGSAFKKEPVSAIASIDKAQYFYLIGRKDRGIEHISDLKGKRIGVVTKTIAEFFLVRFLELYGLSKEQVTLVSINAADSENAIMSGEIDAIMSRPPYLSPIKNRLGSNALIWQAQSSQALYAILIGRNEWITQHPELVERLLNSLAQAENYMTRRPEESKKIVQEHLNLDDEYMTTVWNDNQFSLTLDRSLIVALEDEARWMIHNNLTTEKVVPDFMDYIYVDGLEAIKPEAVNGLR